MAMPFGALSDEFYVSTRLFLKLGLALDRETVLHFFEAIRREFPGMTKLRRRKNLSLVLDEEPNEDGTRRWIRIDDGALRFGIRNPESPADANHLGKRILELAPYHLTLSDLDYDYLEMIYGFELEYAGNHDQLIADTFWTDHPLAALFPTEQALKTIDCQPFLGFTLSEECDLQAYIEVKSRTSTFEVRSGIYEPQPLSVLLTLRQYYGYAAGQSLASAFERLCNQSDEWAADRVVPVLVNPLAHAIASNS